MSKHILEMHAMKQLDSIRTRYLQKHACTIKNVTEVADFKKMRQMQEEAFSLDILSPADIAIDRLHKLAHKNDFTFRMMCDSAGNPLGYYAQYFINPAITSQLRDGILKELEVDSSHCHPLSPYSPFSLHLADIYIRKDLSPLIPQILLQDLRHVHEALFKAGFNAERFTAITATDIGDSMCQRVGLNLVHSFQASQNGFAPKFFEISAEEYHQRKLHTLPIFGPSSQSS